MSPTAPRIVRTYDLTQEIFLFSPNSIVIYNYPAHGTIALRAS